MFKIYRSAILILIGVILLGLGAALNFSYGLSCIQNSDCPPEQICQSSICIFQKGIGVSVTILGAGPPPPEPYVPPPIILPPGQAWPPPYWQGPGVPPAQISFQGKAYPNAFLTILKDEKAAATFLADAAGNFEKTLTGLKTGRYLFEIFAEDTEGRTSVSLNFPTDILEGTFIILSRIFIPPTISVYPKEVNKGDMVNISGQSFPGSKINIFISPGDIAKDTITGPDGKWSLKLDTFLLKEGQKYEVKVMAMTDDGQQTAFSQDLYFSVALGVPVCRGGADLNSDGRVNLVDFSILLYFWKQAKPDNPCADINSDGTVDIIDFSIMMYYWTG